MPPGPLAPREAFSDLQSLAQQTLYTLNLQPFPSITSRWNLLLFHREADRVQTQPHTLHSCGNPWVLVWLVSVHAAHTAHMPHTQPCFPVPSGPSGPQPLFTHLTPLEHTAAAYVNPTESRDSRLICRTHPKKKSTNMRHTPLNKGGGRAKKKQRTNRKITLAKPS